MRNAAISGGRPLAFHGASAGAEPPKEDNGIIELLALGAHHSRQLE